MADEFWHRWKTEYLHNLQYRLKWKGQAVNMKPGDSCNEWSTGIIQRTFSSQDRKTPKAEVTTLGQQTCCEFETSHSTYNPFRNCMTFFEFSVTCMKLVC